MTSFVKKIGGPAATTCLGVIARRRSSSYGPADFAKALRGFSMINFVKKIAGPAAT